MTGWRPLQTPPHELRLPVTLTCGQSFRWRQEHPDCWFGYVQDEPVWLRQTENDVLWRGTGARDLNADLRRLFHLDIPLSPLVAMWSQSDERIAIAAARFTGLRVMRQPLFECLISFICSANNHIPRITGMVERLCLAYGEPVCGLPSDVRRFPTPDRLAAAASDDLRHLGFGYRAESVVQAARAVVDAGPDWSRRLLTSTYTEAHALLCELPGVGPKVADCVCLFALNHTQAIPVDTHVWRIACRDYGVAPLGSSLTRRRYEAVRDLFVRRFGVFAGWAHNLLFVAELDAPQSGRHPTS